MLSNKFSRLIALVFCALLIGCAATRHVQIRDVVDHPREYVGKRVSVEGEVTGTFSLIAIKYFTVNDGTGTIGVISEQPLPRKGAKINVTGTVKEALSLADQTLMMIVEDKAPKPY